LFSEAYAGFLFKFVIKIVRFIYRPGKQAAFSAQKHTKMIKLSSIAEGFFNLMIFPVSNFKKYNYTISVDYESCKILIRPYVFSEIIMVSGLWETYVKEVLFEKTSNKDTIMDIGANIGIYALPLAKKTKKVVAFEPHPTTFSILKKSMELSNISNLTLVQKVVTDSVAKVSYDISTRPMNSRIALFSSKKKIEIDAITLDSFWNLNEPVHWLLIDVEGSEIGVLQGGLNLIRRNLPKIIIEIEANNIEKVANLLKNEGYSLKHLYTMYYYAEVSPCSTKGSKV
jgi:FkbM family methyltransferase